MKNIVLDVDGVFTNGNFIYTKDGKIAKIFGPHDADGVKLLKERFNIQAISADKKGFEITQKRIEIDMGIKLSLVSESERLSWFKDNLELNETIYIADGYHDIKIFEIVGYSIAPNNAFYLTREKANYITKVDAGQGAVLDAALHILEKF